MIWHSAEIDRVLSELAVDDKKGLANGVADMRLEEYGKNIITRVESISYPKRFLKQLNNKIIIVLMIAAVISFIVSLIYDEVNSFSPLLIMAIVLIDAAVSAYNLFRCDNALDSVKDITNPGATVLREGIVKKIPSSELVPGDIIILEAGDYISADARIIECNELRCNESSLTGEEVPVEKKAEVTLDDICSTDKRVNMVYSGCSVVHGTAKAVVTATGLNTEIGRTATIIQQTGEDVLPLQNDLDVIGKIFNIIILIVCAFIFIVSMVQNFSSANFASMTFKVLVNSIALAVAAIPESLPAIATIVIATGIKRIVNDNIIIKDTAALEMIGKTSVICSDKTGILTRNKMTLSRIFDGKKLIDVETHPLDETASTLLKLAAACSTLENDSTEQAIQKACLTYNSMSMIDIENLFPRLNLIPFDSERKCMTTINIINQRPFAIVKGAPEIVVPKCTNCDIEAVLKLNDQMAEDALRIVCIALKPLDEIPANPHPDDIEKQLLLVGLLGLIDPPRETVFESIETCDKAGIRTIMITGDNLTTSKAIARRIGILKDGTEAITGAELKELSDAELIGNIEKYSVFARVSPSDKQRIVNAWQKRGSIVTITGDSICDADALAAADIGCAIGKFGADVAKGNADVIIPTNSFHSIVTAIKESRGMFDNIKKFVHYLLSCNLAELFAVTAGILIWKTMPLAAVQLLWVNLLTDCGPAISLSMEKAEDNVMLRKPITSIGRIFDFGSLITTLVYGLFVSVMTLISYKTGNSAGQNTAMTMAFATLALSQLFHCYNHKSKGTIFNKRLFANRFMNYANGLSLFIVLFLIFTPAGFLFGLTILTTKQFLQCLLLSVLIIPFVEIIKLLIGSRLIKQK